MHACVHACVCACVRACVHVCPVHLRALAYTSTTPTLQRKHHAHLHTPTHTHPYTLPCVQEPLEVVVKDKPGAVTTALWSLLEIMSDPSRKVALAPRTLFNSLRAKLVGMGTMSILRRCRDTPTLVQWQSMCVLTVHFQISHQPISA